MRSKKHPQGSNDDPQIPAVGDADGNADVSVGTRPPATTEDEHVVKTDERPERQVQAVGGWLPNWWKRFITEFYGAHPEKQVAQVYYITAILAVAGSILAGLWAFSKHFWAEESASAPQHSTLTTEALVGTQSAPARALSIVVLPFANLSGDAALDYFTDGITHGLTTDLSRALPEASWSHARPLSLTRVKLLTRDRSGANCMCATYLKAVY